MALIPRLGRFPGGGPGNPLQYSCLENPMNGGAWWATVHRVSKTQTRLKRLSTHMDVGEWGGCNSTVNNHVISADLSQPMLFFPQASVVVGINIEDWDLSPEIASL